MKRLLIALSVFTHHAVHRLLQGLPLILFLTSFMSWPARSAPVYDTDLVAQSSAGAEELDDEMSGSALPVAGYSNEYGGGPQDTFSGSVSLEARYEPKKVKASTSASGASQFIMGTYTRVSARYEDTFLMNALDPFGNPVVGGGTFVANAVFSGAVDAGGGGVYNALGDAFASMTVGGFSSQALLITSNDGSKNQTVAASLVVPWSPFAPVTLIMQAVAEASGSAGTRLGGAAGAFSSSADLSNTLVWMGISEVRDSEGNLVGSFTALSPDGIDYATAAVVPVPAAGWLFLSATGLLGWLRRSKA